MLLANTTHPFRLIPWLLELDSGKNILALGIFLCIKIIWVKMSHFKNYAWWIFFLSQQSSITFLKITCLLLFILVIYKIGKYLGSYTFMSSQTNINGILHTLKTGFTILVPGVIGLLPKVTESKIMPYVDGFLWNSKRQRKMFNQGWTWGNKKGNYLRWYDTVLTADNGRTIMYFTKVLPIALCNLLFNFSFFSDLFRYNCQIAFTFIRYTKGWFDIYIYRLWNDYHTKIG